MREDVLSLQAMGGDRVSEEYLKAELYHRAEALKDIPDAPLFFGRLDYTGSAASGLRFWGMIDEPVVNLSESRTRPTSGDVQITISSARRDRCIAVIAAADDRTLVLDEEKWTRYDPGPGLIGRRRPGPSTCCG